MSIIETPLLTGSTNTTAVVTAAGVIPTPTANVQIPTTVPMSSFRNGTDGTDVTPLNFIFTNNGHLTPNGVSLLGRENFQGITVSTTATDLSHLTGENAIQRNMIDMAAIVVHSGRYDRISISNIQANSRDQSAPIDTTGMEGILLDDFTALNVAACLEGGAACTGYTTRSEALLQKLNAANTRVTQAETRVHTAESAITTANQQHQNQLNAANTRASQAEINLSQAETDRDDFQTQRNIVGGLGASAILIIALVFRVLYRNKVRALSQDNRGNEALRKKTIDAETKAREAIGRVQTLEKADEKRRVETKKRLMQIAESAGLQNARSCKDVAEAIIPTDDQLNSLINEISTHVLGSNISEANLQKIVSIVNELAATLQIVDPTQTGYQPVTTKNPQSLIQRLEAISLKVQPPRENVGANDRTSTGVRGKNDASF